ncbi:MAG TPA: hypothetical protein VGI81_19355 [Tepidisphaeraceae bacterium]|jgi:hypothetical protein
MFKIQRLQWVAIPLLLLVGMPSEADVVAPAEAKPANAYADLNRTIPEFKLDSAVRLEAAIDAVREATHANIVVDWASLEDAGVKRDAPVHIHLWDVTLDQGLRAIEAVADKEGLISHEPQNGIIVIAARDKLRRGGQVVRVYDVRPILDDLIAYRRDRKPATRPARDGASVRPDGVPSLDEATEGLVRMIQTTVEPEGWRDQSWNEGFARPFAGRLVITQTPENHRKIAALLRTLREGGSKDGTQFFGR